MFGDLPLRLALSDPARAPDPFQILKTLPKGAGLIWRSYDEHPSRAALNALSRAARRKGVLLIVAHGSKHRTLPATTHEHVPAFKLNHPLTDKIYKRSNHKLVTAAAHNEREIIAAAHAGVDAVLISPVFATVSHPGAKPLGPLRFAILAHRATSLGLKVIALGGMVTKAQWQRLQGSGAIGLTGISLFKTR